MISKGSDYDNKENMLLLCIAMIMVLDKKMKIIMYVRFLKNTTRVDL